MLMKAVSVAAAILIVLILVQYFTNALPSLLLQIVLWITALLFILHLALNHRKKI